MGGVLFSMEEACSYWSRKVAWRCFLTAAVAAFTIVQVPLLTHMHYLDVGPLDGAWRIRTSDCSPRFRSLFQKSWGVNVRVHNDVHGF